MSSAAADSEVLFWFVAALTLLLLFIAAVVMMRPGTAGSPPPPQSSIPAPPPLPAREPELLAVFRPQVPGGPPWGPAPRPPGLAGWDAVSRLAVLGQLPGERSAYRIPQPVPVLVPRARISPDAGGLRPTQIARGRAPSGGQAGAHRRESRRGAHRAGQSSGWARGSANHAGRHRAGVHYQGMTP